MRFDQTYVANPVCVPARYSLLSGHMPHRFDGMEVNHQSIKKPFPVMADSVSTPSIGRCLQAAGYDTAYGGKLHVVGFPLFKPDLEEQPPFFRWASFINPHDAEPPDAAHFSAAACPAVRCLRSPTS